jgi:hypothetical protein
MPRSIDLDELEHKATAARPGPWEWYGNTKTSDVYLATVNGGRVFVMDFARWGMAGGQPRFQVDHQMVSLGQLGKDESPLGPKFEVSYRRQFVGIGHPDARHIAANSPDVTLALVARIRELEETLRFAVPAIASLSENDGDRCREILEKGAVIEL